MRVQGFRLPLDTCIVAPAEVNGVRTGDAESVT